MPYTDDERREEARDDARSEAGALWNRAKELMAESQAVRGYAASHVDLADHLEFVRRADELEDKAMAAAEEGAAIMGVKGERLHEMYDALLEEV